MPLQIDRVNTQVDVLPSGQDGDTMNAYTSVTDTELLERLRPLVIEIMEEQMDRLRREAG
ncbi:MAG: hypothetical protein LJE85_14090 [Gammaproteobacteria bacterium]|jgi:hypothetical protein|nr:hypothetical protein [Gammaproteobacteria bacterium]